jgi:hypothetical protein
MSGPIDTDVSIYSGKAIETFAETKLSEDSSDWCYAALDDVRKNIVSTGYPEELCHFIKGKVVDTIPDKMPSDISILRLDTDWYESTRHELTLVFPQLKLKGVLIIDDYGHWEGARKAVDEYFARNKISILLNRIDYTGRVAIKVESADNDERLHNCFIKCVWPSQQLNPGYK